MLPKSEVMNKEMDDLLSENKHLKTSLHWISDELNKLKSEKQIQGMRVMNSGCLEEGPGKLTLVSPINTKDMDISSYINHLHNTIKILKSQLSRSLYYLKKIDSDNFSKMKLVAIGKGNSGSFDYTTGHCDVDFNTNAFSTNGNDAHAYFNYQDGNHQNGIKNLEKVDSNDLYPSLLQNLQMQQTKTYLNSNASKPAIPKVQSSSSLFKTNSPRKIQLYDEYSSD